MKAIRETSTVAETMRHAITDPQETTIAPMTAPTTAPTAVLETTMTAAHVELDMMVNPFDESRAGRPRFHLDLVQN